MDIFIFIIVAVLSAGLAGAIVYFVQKSKAPKTNTPSISEDEAIRLASEKAQERITKAQSEAQEIRDQAEEYARKTRKEITEQEALMVEREQSFNKRSALLDKRAQDLELEIENNKKVQELLEKNRTKLKTELERISQLTRDEARQQLINEIDEDLKNYKAKKIREVEKEVEAESDEKAKYILVQAMQKISTDYVGETTTATIKLEDEKIKGRIIGKDGRNIRSFEKATGVDLIVDESPTEIGLSSFDPLRREIARVSMLKLISDGRIHPGAIEDEVRKAKNEIATEIKKNGLVLAEEAGWPGIDPELIKLLGKMKYRSSYGQSLMRHTVEVIRIGSAIAAELGADMDLVKRACLLHDIGKVLTHKVEGPHHHISGQIARKFNLPDNLVNAIEAHHLDIEPTSVEAVVVYLADAISGARPGARKDNYESYIKRVEGIEKIAKEVGGDKLEEVYAIHAGREVRVIVKPLATTDDDIVVMAKEIADGIQKTQTYPGTVQVTVIREKRAIEMAS
ncbi:MAG TPA: ribonuclease Y [Candidatus Dojkabacteria bacterium]|nr:ribonuclease Y [Candidatus Dojkabacteria bacterium]